MGLNKHTMKKIISYLPVIIGFIVILIADYITKDMPIIVTGKQIGRAHV